MSWCRIWKAEALVPARGWPCSPGMDFPPSRQLSESSCSRGSCRDNVGSVMGRITFWLGLHGYTDFSTFTKPKVHTTIQTIQRLGVIGFLYLFPFLMWPHLIVPHPLSFNVVSWIGMLSTEAQLFFFFFSPVATAQVLILKALGTPTFKHSHHLIKNMGNTTCNIKKCNIEASFQKKEYNIHPNNHCYYYILTFQLIYLDWFCLLEHCRCLCGF